ncbi:MAG: LPS export ABC transporter ATP-binding protein [Deltaproteobacteria bacterium]|nr:LPS export ABC transporter ATP-binding protein [Deltaproteobacteria bacterium]
MIQGIHLTKSFGKRVVVRDVSIKCSGGEVIGLLGPNGAGKTTTFYMIVGELKPDGGSVTLDGSDITHLPMYKRARLGLGYLPQDSSVFRNMTVLENILVALERRADLGSRKEMDELAFSILSEFGLDKVANSLAYTLSGGERRRTEIARACALNPRFFLLDEPFAGIDPLAIRDLQAIIGYLKQKGIGIIITDHNVRDTLNICDRAYVLIDGQIVVEGTSREIMRDEKAIKYYLGDSFRVN